MAVISKQKRCSLDGIIVELAKRVNLVVGIICLILVISLNQDDLPINTVAVIDTGAGRKANETIDSLPLERRSKSPKSTGMDDMPSVTALISEDNDSMTAFQINNFDLIKNSKSPIPVFVFPLHLTDRNYMTDELKHFVVDGIQRSPYLKLVTNISYKEPHLVWVAQLMLGRAPAKWCRHFAAIVGQTWKQNKWGKKDVPLILMDWHDNTNWVTCGSNVHKDVTFYTKRGIVEGRGYNMTADKVTPGQIETFQNWSDYAAAPLRHTPYAVRSDYFDGLRQVLVQRQLMNNSTELERFDLPGIDRSMDVVHFWPPRGPGVDRGGRVPNSLLRHHVTLTLLKMPVLKSWTALAGTANMIGRNAVDLAYPAKILEFKIVIVAQKDSHEEHYRLMEALVSGALVLSDVMLTMPKDFKDGESIVLYRNMEELQEKIHYYLNNSDERLGIARKGYELAVRRHRSFHLMEEVFFGKLLSPAIPSDSLV